MWLERTQQAELVDLEVGEENNLEEGEGTTNDISNRRGRGGRRGGGP